jgi:hypothetical protein
VGHPEDQGMRYFRNVGNCLPVDTAERPYVIVTAVRLFLPSHVTCYTFGLCLLRGTNFTSKCSSGEFCCLGRATTQAVIRRAHTAEARVRSEVSPCAICEARSGTGTSTSGFPVSVIPPILHTHLQSRVLTRRTNGRSLGTFQRRVLLRKWGSTGHQLLLNFL